MCIVPVSEQNRKLNSKQFIVKFTGELWNYFTMHYLNWPLYYILPNAVLWELNIGVKAPRQYIILL